MELSKNQNLTRTSNSKNAEFSKQQNSLRQDEWLIQSKENKVHSPSNTALCLFFFPRCFNGLLPWIQINSLFLCCTSTRNSSDSGALLLYFFLFLFVSIPFLIFNSKWWNLLLLAPTERLKDGDSLFIHMQVEFISRNAIHSHHFPFSAVLLLFFFLRNRPKA